MNRLGRALLLVGALVLAFLIGLLVGRHQASQPAVPPAEAASTAGVQINTKAPPPVIQPLPPPPPAPKRAEIPKLNPDEQVNADAAAVGMTTPNAPPPSANPPSGAQGAGNATADDAQAAAPSNGQ